MFLPIVLAPRLSAPKPLSNATPEVSAVEPASAGRGSLLKVKIKGKNFAPGARISFSNPGIRVLEITQTKGSELTARIQIAAEAATGSTSLYVVNPDDAEVEAQFKVTEEAPVTEGQTPAAPDTTAKPESSPSGSGRKPTSSPSGSESPDSEGGASGRRFEVYGLGKLGAILRAPGNAPKGVLALAAGKLTYTEEDKRVFAVRPSEVREIATNTILGVNTGTFHVMLHTGKTYNFIAASLRPADAESIVDSLQHWLR